MLSLHRRKEFRNLTVEELISELKAFPKEARVFCNGSSSFYAHVDKDKEFITFDDDSLEHEYEEDDDKITIGYTETIKYAMETVKLKDNFEIKLSEKKSIHVFKEYTNWYDVYGIISNENTKEIYCKMSASSLNDLKHIIGITYMNLESARLN